MQFKAHRSVKSKEPMEAKVGRPIDMLCRTSLSPSIFNNLCARQSKQGYLYHVE